MTVPQYAAEVEDFICFTAPRQVAVSTEFLCWPTRVDLNHKNNFTFGLLRMLLNVPKLLEGKIKIIMVVAFVNLTRTTQVHTG
jgi:hypothetical protein